MIRALLVALLLGALAGPAQALTMDRYEFASEAQRERFRELLAELRCLVCQNESLADSPAELAGDLRDQVYEQMQQGKSNEEIIDYLVARYGDFVRYRPPVEPATYLLWFGPPLILLAGLVFAARLLGRRRGPEPPLDPQQRRRATELLDDDGGGR